MRHFLIEPTPKGVRLRGCSNEPVFGSLAALVYQHSVTPLALPCKLALPEGGEYKYVKLFPLERQIDPLVKYWAELGWTIKAPHLFVKLNYI